jgi:hypothetical protein
MPKTARDASVADYVLPPQDMPAALLEHASRAGRPPEKEGNAGDRDQGMGAVYRMLEQEFGIDFAHYKPSTITRRIERRLQLSHVDDVDDYVEKLKGEHKELDVLYRDLLIGVTRFFRNEEAFDILEKEVLLKTGDRDTPFRVWVAGCATGEEVYSLAILLNELTVESGRPFKIFATDVHRGSLEQATRALYEEEARAPAAGSREPAQQRGQVHAEGRPRRARGEAAERREVLCALLSDAGYHCESSDNGAAGLALIEAFKPQAAVIDIGLPELDGLELPGPLSHCPDGLRAAGRSRSRVAGRFRRAPGEARGSFDAAACARNRARGSVTSPYACR